MEERCNIIEQYILSQKNSNRAQQAYAETYPEANIPDALFIRRLYKKWRQSGSVDIIRKRNRPRRAEQIAKENRILDFYRHNRDSSLRNAVLAVNATRCYIHRVLKKHNFKAYKVMPLHRLLPQDLPARRNYCQIILNHQLINNEFLRNILWTDEAAFTTSGIFNRQNRRIWQIENPRAIEQIQRQGRQTLGVWCGILGDKIIGPIFFNHNLTGQIYLHWLQNEIEEFLDDLPVQQYGNIIWQQDGAPVHNTRAVTTFLNRRYELWIGKHGIITWPSRSPDLNPLDAFLWGHLKTVAYRNRANNVAELQQRIVQEIHRINTNPHILQNVRLNTLERYRECIRQNGNHIEHLRPFRRH